ncbi:MAG TPA: hypothetical protein VKR83_09470 [Ktedonobacteraceae bacterium]|nr:hypothetical protein [Ktedonobacteraceae bacterium]
MSHFLKGKHVAFILVAITLVAGVMGGVALRGASHAAAPAKAGRMAVSNSKSAFCSQVGKTIFVSSGAMMYCFGPQPNGPGAGTHSNKKNRFGSNVDAASPAEDVSPNGTQAYGQSEVSTAAVGSYVVEGWNDATAFFSPPCSPGNKDQLSGWGFSSNGGKSFTDEGGLPNTDCATSSWSGDPSVEAWAPGGTPYFYQSGLISGSFPGGAFGLDVALTACKVSPPSSITCNPTPTFLTDSPGSINIEDKEFMSIDPVRQILYVSFTDFFNGPNGDDITLWACDISNPGTPVCHGPLYVAGTSPCEVEGAYPAVDLATGDVYIAYESNWATNIFTPACFSVPVQNVVNQVGSPCTLPVATFPNACPAENAFTKAAVNITSMDAALIPGYNRFPMNDFPRIAVSDPFKTVSIVWNDARFHPAGDILLQSFWKSTFPATVQSAPVRINSATGGWHMLPALRNTDDDGDLQISFYGRASANTDVTNVYAAIDVAPTTTATHGNVLVTTAPSAWVDVSSDIIPNFGDYTDNYVIATAGAPYTQQTLYVAWSDGRLGDPQPFNAHAHTN